MNAKKLIALLMALCMVFVLCACGGGSPTAEEEPAATTAEKETADTAPEEETADAAVEAEPVAPADITVAYSTVSYSLAPMTTVLADNIKACVEGQGWTFNMLSAEGDVELQGEQVSQLISMDPDYLVLMPGDPALAVDWIDEAVANDIEVILVMTPVAESEDDTLCFVGVDHEGIVKDIYDYMVEKNPDTQLNIVEIAGVPVQSDYIIRTNAYNALIESNENLTQLGDIAWAYSSRADAQTAMENFLTAYGDQINVVMGFADNLTLGACAALDEAGRDDVQVYSIAYCVNSHDAVAKGQMVTMFLSMHSMADKILECIQASVAGEDLEYTQYIDCPIVDASNMDQYEAEY